MTGEGVESFRIASSVLAPEGNFRSSQSPAVYSMDAHLV